jgi:hypothetical protein
VKNVVKIATAKSASKPVMGAKQRSAPTRKPAAARTARAPKVAAGGKRKR